MAPDFGIGNVQAVSIGFIVMLINLFLWINAPAFYPETTASAQRIILTYIVMLTYALVITQKRPDLLDAGLTSLYNGLFMFLVSAVLLASAGFLGGWLGALSGEAGIGVVLLQAFSVAYTEEVVFRGILPEQLGTDLWPNLLFGPFHFYVYSGSLVLMLFAGILGVIFTLVRWRFGLMGAIGAHTAWNLKAMGLIDRIVSGG